MGDEDAESGVSFEKGAIAGSVASGDETDEFPVVVMVPPVRPSAAALRADFAALDEWQLEEVFAHRGSLMRSVPRFLWGSFRIATKLALEEILKGEESGNVTGTGVEVVFVPSSVLIWICSEGALV